MRTVNRDGIQIEQCSGCRGVFLDAGELEAIIAAEDRYYSEPAQYEPPPEAVRAPRSPAPPPPTYGRPTYRDSPPPYGGGYRDSPPPHGHRRKKSFLESLFD